LGKGSQNFHDTIVFLEHLREWTKKIFLNSGQV
jgi:hypothetical protein